MGNRIARPVRTSTAAAVLPPPLKYSPKSTPTPTPTPTSSPSSPPPTAVEPRKVDLGPRQTLNTFWTSPTTVGKAARANNTLQKLQDGGFVHMAGSGIFQLLPLGLRVQDKICRLIDKEMRNVGADKLQLSTLTPQALWQTTGRLQNTELFRLQDRHGKGFVLSPTHEEAITSLASHFIPRSPGVPLRVYQITQKYRDELRPRQGLLRARDFLMKDLYTFDSDVKSALATYNQVRAAYSRIFTQLSLPMLVAEASSGDIGGDLSHEYHLPTEIGEDNVVHCKECNYVANEEVAKAGAKQVSNSKPGQHAVWRGISKCRTTVVNVWCSSSSFGQKNIGSNLPTSLVHLQEIKRAFPDLDTSVADKTDVLSLLRPGPLKLVNLFDVSVSQKARTQILNSNDVRPPQLPASADIMSLQLHCNADVSFIRAQEGNSCPRCRTGTLKLTKAIELGHTFHLGTRYSKPLGCKTMPPATPSSPPTTADRKAEGKEEEEEEVDSVKGHSETAASSSSTWSKPTSGSVPVQMGCHGIGITRLMGAVADHFSGTENIVWPRAIAPYDVVIVSRKGKASTTANGEEKELSCKQKLYDTLTDIQVDTVLDNQAFRRILSHFTLYDAIGIPIWVVVGGEWHAKQEVDVRCPQLKYNKLVKEKDVPRVVQKLLSQLP